MFQTTNQFWWFYVFLGMYCWVYRISRKCLMIWSTGAHLGHGVNLELAALVAHEKHPEGHGAQASGPGIGSRIGREFHLLELHHLMLVPSKYH